MFSPGNTFENWIVYQTSSIYPGANEIILFQLQMGLSHVAEVDNKNHLKNQSFTPGGHCSNQQSAIWDVWVVSCQLHYAEYLYGNGWWFQQWETVLNRTTYEK